MAYARHAGWMVGLVVFLVVAAPARAGLFDYTASLELDFGSVAPFTIQAQGQVDLSPDGSFVFPAGVLATTRTLTPPQTTYEGIRSIALQLANGTGAFNAPSSPGGTMGLNGQAVLNLQTFLSLPPLTLAMTPLGSGGSDVTSGSNGSTAATFTLTGALWQTGMFRQTGTSISGSSFATRTNTGQDLRTAGGVGVVTYVVPAYVTTRIDGGFTERSPVSALLTITIVPEPARFLGPAALATLLAIRGWHLVRRRRAA